MTAVPTVAPLPVRAALDLRVLRAVPFATVCVVLSAAGHAFASGCSVPLGAVVLGWLAVCAGGVVLAGRERSLRAISGGLAVGETVLHMLFRSAQAAVPGGSGMADMTGISGMGDMADMPGMAVPVHGRLGQLGVRAAAAPHAGFWWHAVFLGLSPVMLALHLVAAVVAGWWLRRGEAAVWRLVRLTAETAATTARACVAVLEVALALATALLGGLVGSERGPMRTVTDGESGCRPFGVVLRHAVIRRGPPGVAFAV